LQLVLELPELQLVYFQIKAWQLFYLLSLLYKQV